MVGERVLVDGHILGRGVSRKSSALKLASQQKSSICAPVEALCRYRKSSVDPILELFH